MAEGLVIGVLGDFLNDNLLLVVGDFEDYELGRAAAETELVEGG